MKMPKSGHHAMVGDAENISSRREQMRRWAIRELKNQDIADIFLEDGDYPEYESWMRCSSILMEPPEKLRWYAIAIARYNRKMEELEASRKKLFSTIMGQICNKSQKEVAKAAG